MKIYIYKKGQNFGPYTAEETLSRIKTGEFSKDDLGWCHGLPEATPLSQIIVDAKMGKINPPPEAQSADIILAHERNIALKQKALICITAAWLVLGFMPMWESIAPFISLAFWLMHIAGIVVCCQLAVALKKNIGLWICLTIVPGVNLFGFAKMAHDAGEMLKCRAVRCGIFGAKWGEIQKLKTN